MQAQNFRMDSLRTVLKTAQEDTGKIYLLNELAWEISTENPDTAILISTQALEIENSLFAKKSTSPKFKKALINFMAQTYHQMGWFAYLNGDYIGALKNDEEALLKWDEVGNKSGKAKTIGNMGIVYKEQGDYPKALVFYLKALQISEELKDKRHVAINFANIGIIYKKQGDLNKALEYYFKALKIAEEIKDRVGIAADYGNIGNIYYNQRNFKKALEYYLKCLKMAEELEYKQLQANAVGNIGLVYTDLKNNAKAIEYYLKALQMAKELNDQNGIARHLGNIGIFYKDQKENAKAEIYFLKALKLADSIGSLDLIKDNEDHLSELYTIMGQYKMALDHYKKHIIARDSLFNEENTKKTVQAEMNFEFEKKETETKLEQEKKEAVAAAESRKQKIIIWSVCGILVLVFGFAVFAYRSFLQKKKANQEITLQKHIIEEKQKEILDSIYYARRIQRALLPTEKYIERNLKK